MQLNLPTDERLKNFNSTNDPAVCYAVLSVWPVFVDLFFTTGRTTSQPCRASGIIKSYPPWDSKYTININAEMNYWPAEKTNLAEMHEPFIKW